ncbi:MAG: glutathione S-transferase N-terminal domain-containing protein [Pseudomonadota bacterium]
MPQSPQAPENQPTESYQLFKTDICGFCYRVRAFLEQHGIEVPLRDVNQDQAAFRELLENTRRTTVPCLRIARQGAAGEPEQVEWMFESLDIMHYLAQRHGITG